MAPQSSTEDTPTGMTYTQVTDGTDTWWEDRDGNRYWAVIPSNEVLGCKYQPAKGGSRTRRRKGRGKKARRSRRH